MWINSSIQYMISTPYKPAECRCLRQCSSQVRSFLCWSLWSSRGQELWDRRRGLVWRLQLRVWVMNDVGSEMMRKRLELRQQLAGGTMTQSHTPVTDALTALLLKHSHEPVTCDVDDSATTCENVIFLTFGLRTFLQHSTHKVHLKLIHTFHRKLFDFDDHAHNGTVCQLQQSDNVPSLWLWSVVSGGLRRNASRSWHPPLEVKNKIPIISDFIYGVSLFLLWKSTENAVNSTSFNVN